MDVRLVTSSGVEDRTAEDLPALLDKPDSVVWVDIDHCDSAALRMLTEVFGFHWMAVRDCSVRNHASKVHVYDDHVFVVLHAPELGRRGHVHYVELDTFVGHNYLVTVHGPLNPAVDPAVTRLDTDVALRRLRQKPPEQPSAFDVAHNIVSSMIRRELDLVATLAEQSGRLEQRVMLSEQRDEDPEEFLAELFQTWYVLLAVRTMAIHSAASFNRLANLVRAVPDVVPLLADISDQFEMVQTMADGQREFLHGVIEYYQTLISTHLTVAAERDAEASVRQNDDMRRISAWVAIVAVPTAVTGFFGQNVPYPGFQEASGFVASVTLIVLGALVLYLAFKRKRWL